LDRLTAPRTRSLAHVVAAVAAVALPVSPPVILVVPWLVRVRVRSWPL
jgi:hypothetical protein